MEPFILYCPVCRQKNGLNGIWHKPRYDFKTCKVCDEKLGCYSHNDLLFSFSNDENFKEYYCEDHDQIFRVNCEFTSKDIHCADRICHNCRDDKNFVIKLIEYEYFNLFHNIHQYMCDKNVLIQFPTVFSNEIKELSK